MLDKKSLSSVNDTTGEGLTAVLTETKADTKEELQANIDAIKKILEPFDLFKPAYFTDKPEEYSNIGQSVRESSRRLEERVRSARRCLSKTWRST